MLLRVGFMLAALGLVTALSASGCATGSGDGLGDEDGGTGAGSAAGGAGSGGTGGISAGMCNDGFLDPGEMCDQTNFDGQTCESFGFPPGGNLACNPTTCNIDTSGCVTAECGNNMAEMGEQCDGTDLKGETCQTQGFAGGTLMCIGCMFTGCSDDYTQDFELGGLPMGFTTSGGAQWATSTVQPHAGAQSLASGTIGSSSSTTVTVTLSFATGGMISYWYRVDSEPTYDELIFSIDNVPQAYESGNTGWQQASFGVSAGSHTFSWTYDKDSSISEGFDRAWIDDIQATGGVLP